MQFLPHLRGTMRRRLSSGGQVLVAAGLVAGAIGLDPANTQVHLVFTSMLGLFAGSLLVGFWRRPRRRHTSFTWHVPGRVVCHGRLPLTLRVTNRDRKPWWDVEVALVERPPTLRLTEPLYERVAWLPPGETMTWQRSLEATRRGSYRVHAPIVSTVFPFGLVRWGFMPDEGRTVLVTPVVHPVRSLDMAPGMRYQAGGIPLASAVGESMELLGVREYRPGDAIRKIHWKLWARRGKPVVREYQQEFYSRVALIVDTFVPRRPTRRHSERFEAAVSAAASLANAISLQDSILDIFAAGPEIYFLTVGRQLGFLQNVMDVLACVEPCREPPFEKLKAVIGEHLIRVTAVLVVLMDLDADRLAFLRAIHQTGVWLKVLVVREEPPTLPPADHPDVLEHWKQIRPSALAADLLET
ncbi:MAG TPA: DUF58 domain-containing protein [Candidatus Xenobia bacterium]|jgi:uncharacterized protein (DUF58 family)